MIEVKNIWKTFGELEVLKGVNLDVKKGEIVAIIGKGHEATLERGGLTLPFPEREIVEEYMSR